MQLVSQSRQYYRQIYSISTRLYYSYPYQRNLITTTTAANLLFPSKTKFINSFHHGPSIMCFPWCIVGTTNTPTTDDDPFAEHSSQIVSRTSKSRSSLNLRTYTGDTRSINKVYALNDEFQRTRRVPRACDIELAEEYTNKQSDITETESDNPNVIAGKYELIELIGSGSFGNVYSCKDVSFESKSVSNLNDLSSVVANESLAIKILKQTGHQSFYRETMILNYLQTCNIASIPNLHYFGQSRGMDIVVMQRLGTDLSTLFNFCGKKFSLPTVLKLTVEMLTHLESLHKNFVIHRDIKPHNFLTGYHKDEHYSKQTFLIDFGLSKYYKKVKRDSSGNSNNFDATNQKREHIEKVTGLTPVGTARYASVWTHQGITQSRRDDLEALGFVWVYFYKGKLPWQGIPLKNRKDKWVKIGKLKESTTLEELCDGLPKQYKEFFKYVRKLKFAQEPDYKYMKKLFLDAAHSTSVDLDNIRWDWDIKGFEHR